MPVPPEALAGLLGPLQVPLACLLARTILPLLQSTVSRQLAEQLDPAAPSPAAEQTQAKPVCPPGQTGSVPVMGLKGAARLAAPTPPYPPTAPAEEVPPNLASAQTTNQPIRKEPKIKREGTRQQKGAGDQTPEPVSGGQVGAPNEGPANPNAELHQWLEVCARLLGPDLSAQDSPDGPGSPCFPQPVLRT